MRRLMMAIQQDLTSATMGNSLHVSISPLMMPIQQDLTSADHNGEQRVRIPVSLDDGPPACGLTRAGRNGK